jgi:pyroglutamyl-peptidase
MKTVLLTGFEPFGGDSVNPSGEVARELDGAAIAGHEVFGVVLPCVFGRATEELKQLIELRQPSLVICLGMAARRSAITPERVAINLADASIPDNEGQQPVDEPLASDGPAAYWSTLPVKAIVLALQEQGLPAAISLSADAFVCNSVFYGLMHELARRGSGIPGGFIHVPGLPTQAIGGPGMPLEQIVAAVRLAIETALEAGAEVHTPGDTAS